MAFWEATSRAVGCLAVLRKSYVSMLTWLCVCTGIHEILDFMWYEGHMIRRVGSDWRAAQISNEVVR